MTLTYRIFNRLTKQACFSAQQKSWLIFHSSNLAILYFFRDLSTASEYQSDHSPETSYSRICRDLRLTMKLIFKLFFFYFWNRNHTLAENLLSQHRKVTLP